MNPPRVYACSQSWTPVPPPSPYHPSGSSQCTSPKLPVSCIKPGLVFLFFFFFFIFKLYIIVLVLPNIKMNPPQVYMCSPSWTLLPPPSPFHPSGSVSYIIHVFMPFSQIIPPPLPQSPKDCSIHLSLLLSPIQGYPYHLSKFHIYALVYCNGVFLSGLLHSV